MYCGYCFRKAQKKGIFCENHEYIWDTLCEKTKVQVNEKSKLSKRMFQIYVNKIIIVDDLNKCMK